jgi:hypothetical protein
MMTIVYLENIANHDDSVTFYTQISALYILFPHDKSYSHTVNPSFAR